MRTIVTLTSYGHRLKTTCPKAIRSLFMKDFSPDKVILYVAEKDRKMVGNQFDGLPIEIRYVADYMSHKKFLGLADRTLDDDFIVIVDDDLQYKPYFWQKMWRKYEKYAETEQNFIICNRAQTLSERRYSERKFVLKEDADKGRLIFGSGAGLLIPPKTMRISEDFVKEGYEIAPHCDESYYSAYCIKEGITTICTGHPQCFYPIPLPKEDSQGLWDKFNRFEKDDTLAKVLAHFGVKNAEDVTISFTSWRKRIRYASAVVKRMRAQNHRPNRIILTLSEDEFPQKEKELPNDLIALISDNFCIKWTKKNTKTFKKLLPLFEIPENEWLLIIDDDVEYPNDFIDNMLQSADGSRPITGSWLKTDYRQYGNSLSANGSMTLIKPKHCLPMLKRMSDYALNIQDDIASDPILTYSVLAQGLTFGKCKVNYRDLQAKTDGRYPAPYSAGKEGRARSEKTHEICQHFLKTT